MKYAETLHETRSSYEYEYNSSSERSSYINWDYGRGKSLQRDRSHKLRWAKMITVAESLVAQGTIDISKGRTRRGRLIFKGL